jgi:hypothetical protein
MQPILESELPRIHERPERRSAAVAAVERELFHGINEL